MPIEQEGLAKMQVMHNELPAVGRHRGATELHQDRYRQHIQPDLLQYRPHLLDIDRVQNQHEDR